MRRFPQKKADLLEGMLLRMSENRILIATCLLSSMAFAGPLDHLVNAGRGVIRIQTRLVSNISRGEDRLIKLLRNFECTPENIAKCDSCGPNNKNLEDRLKWLKVALRDSSYKDIRENIEREIAELEKLGSFSRIPTSKI